MNLFKAIILILLLLSFKSYAQKETHIAVQVQCLRDASTINTLPTVIANNKDTLRIDKRYNSSPLNISNYFDLKYSDEYNPGRKVSLEIKHPHYPILNLDSVNISTPIRLKLLKLNEYFYVSNGIKILLNYQREYVSVKFEGNSNIDSLLNILYVRHKLEVAVDFRDSIKIKKTDKHITYSKDGYGGIEDILYYTFWFKKEDGTIFYNSDSMYYEIRNIPHVSYLGVPQSFSENLINGFIIYLKKGISAEEIELLVSKYYLKKDEYYSTYLKYHSDEHHFTTYDLIPDNQMMIALMKEHIVKTVMIKEISYDLDCKK
jgi:hypothetical protein